MNTCYRCQSETEEEDLIGCSGCSNQVCPECSFFCVNCSDSIERTCLDCSFNYLDCKNYSCLSCSSVRCFGCKEVFCPQCIPHFNDDNVGWCDGCLS